MTASTVALQAVDLPPELQPFLAEDDASDSPVNIYRDKSPARCLRSQSFWYLFFSSAVCSGAGLTLLNNTAQMVWPPTQPASMLLSCWHVVLTVLCSTHAASNSHTCTCLLFSAEKKTGWPD